MKTETLQMKASRYFITAAFMLIVFAVIFMTFSSDSDIILKLKAAANGIFLATYFSFRGFAIESKRKSQTEEEVRKHV